MISNALINFGFRNSLRHGHLDVIWNYMIMIWYDAIFALGELLKKIRWKKKFITIIILATKICINVRFAGKNVLVNEPLSFGSIWISNYENKLRPVRGLKIINLENIYEQSNNMNKMLVVCRSKFRFILKQHTKEKKIVTNVLFVILLLIMLVLFIIIRKNAN